MQPVIPYKAGSYPPRGAQWPQFGSDTMQQTLTHEVHENLRQKREHMRPHHEDRLGYHGLLPTEYYIGETFDTQGTQTESSASSQGTQSGFLSRSQGTQIDQDEGMPMETDMPEASSSYGPMRRPKVRSSPMTGSVVTAQITPEAQAMEDDTATVNYEMSETETVDYEPLEIDDHEMRTSSKRMIETDDDKKKKSKLSPMDPPKPKIKKEKKVVKPSGEVDDEVQVSAIQPNKNGDISFWKEQSANELRAQLKLRDLQKFRNEWAFKSKDQLIQIIQDMISAGTW